MSAVSRPRRQDARPKAKAARPAGKPGGPKSASTAPTGWRGLLTNTKVSRREIIAFSRELSTLLDAGIGISPALELLAEERKGTPFERVIRQLKEDLNTGSTIGGAMAKHPTVFPKIYIRTVATADKGAPLAQTLLHSADFMDAAQSAISQAKRALIYPALVVLVGVGVVFMLLTVSLPQMVSLFNNLDAELPLPTKILIGASNFIRADGIYLVPVIAVIVFGFVKFIKTVRGRLWLHQMLLRVPMLKSVIMTSDMSRAAAAISSLSKAGLTLPEALDVARDTVSNEVVRNALIEAQKGLLAGEGLAKPLGRAGIFPNTFIQTIKVAEDTGTLDANLRRMGDMYGKEASDRVKAMASMVEPLATVSVALVVGFIALAVILPMYTVLGAIDKH